MSTTPPTTTSSSKKWGIGIIDYIPAWLLKSMEWFLPDGDFQQKLTLMRREIVSSVCLALIAITSDYLVGLYFTPTPTWTAANNISMSLLLPFIIFGTVFIAKGLEREYFGDSSSLRSGRIRFTLLLLVCVCIWKQAVSTIAERLYKDLGHPATSLSLIWNSQDIEQPGKVCRVLAFYFDNLLGGVAMIILYRLSIDLLVKTHWDGFLSVWLGKVDFVELEKEEKEGDDDPNANY